VLAGWHSHLDFLAEALDGHPVDWPNWPLHRWREEHDSYLWVIDKEGHAT
jgi:hypothetical protein